MSCPLLVLCFAVLCDVSRVLYVGEGKDFVRGFVAN